VMTTVVSASTISMGMGSDKAINRNERWE
jgi:hypothetical protein